MKVNTQREYYRTYNGAEIKIINTKREDGFIEVFLPEHSVFILLFPDELEDE